MLNDRLTIFHDDDGTFIDLSQDLEDFGRDSIPLPFVSAQDFLYIGFRKPLPDMFFVETKIKNTTESNLTMERYQNGSFEVIDSRDETLGMIRPGFIKYKNGDDEDLQVTTINGVELYWIRLRWDADFDLAMELQGLGIVWSDDQDLIEEYDDIMSCLASGATSFILKHQAARKQIVQDLRNQGNRKQKGNKNLQHINEFDLLRPEMELRQASKFMALHKIFFSIKDDPEGIYTELSKDFKSMAASNFDSLVTTIDIDDDGKLDTNEEMVSSTISIRRI